MTEHGDRAAFLAPVRSRLAAAPAHAGLRPVRDLAEGTPVVDHAIDTSDRVGAFCTALAKAGGTARVVDGDLAAVLAEVVDAEGVRRAVVTDEPECDGVAAMLGRLGVEVAAANVAANAAADLGVTGATVGIAATGTVVVDAARAQGRTASLLPRVHLALLPAERVLATPGDFFRTLPDVFPAGLPSQFVLITGPSRSADIELHLTLGVHGPRALWVGLLAR